MPRPLESSGILRHLGADTRARFCFRRFGLGLRMVGRSGRPSRSEGKSEEPMAGTGYRVPGSRLQVPGSRLRVPGSAVLPLVPAVPRFDAQAASKRAPEPQTAPRTTLDTPSRRSPRKSAFRARLGIQTPTGSPNRRLVHRPLDGETCPFGKPA